MPSASKWPLMASWKKYKKRKSLIINYNEWQHFCSKIKFLLFKTTFKCRWLCLSCACSRFQKYLFIKKMCIIQNNWNSFMFNLNNQNNTLKATISFIQMSIMPCWESIPKKMKFSNWSCSAVALANQSSTLLRARAHVISIWYIYIYIYYFFIFFF